MEPLSALSSTTLWLRPHPAALPDLTRVLRAGQIVAGEVLQTLGGGSVLVGVGRHRIPADGSADLVSGERLWFEVRVAKNGGLVLHVIERRDAALDAGTARALRALAGESSARASLLREVATALAAHAAAGLPSSALAERLRRAIEGHAFRAGDGAEVLARLVRSDGLTYEARLAALSRDDAAAIAELERDLKALLLGAHDALPAGAACDALARALQSLEIEQLGNLLRQAAGEPAQHALAIDGGARWTNARLTVLRDVHDAGAEDRSGEGEPTRPIASRASLDVELEHAGEVRAEFRWIDGRLAVRIEARDSGRVELLRAGLAELEARLAPHFGDVHASVALRGEDRSALGSDTARPADPSAHLVDLSG